MSTVDIYRADQTWGVFQNPEGDYINVVLREHPKTCVLCDGSFMKEPPAGRYNIIIEKEQRFIWVPNCSRPPCHERAGLILGARLTERIESAELTCVLCKTKLPRMKICRACKEATYCNRECQKADWPKHKLICKR